MGGLQEKKEQRQLTEWIQGQTMADVFWGEDPESEYGTFRFTGPGQPDLLAQTPSEDGLNIVSEVKDGGDSGGVYSAMKELHEYWTAYEFDGAQVKVSDEVVDVDVFVVATQYSSEGHLFRYDPDNSGPDGDDREKGWRRTYNAAYEGTRSDGPDIRPQYAYARSEAIPPILRRYAWYEAERVRDTNRENIETGIGVLLSNALDSEPSSQDTFGDPTPKVQWYDGAGKEQWVSL